MCARWQDYGDFSNGAPKVVLDQSISMHGLATRLNENYGVSVRRAMMDDCTPDEEIVGEARRIGAIAVTMDRGFPRDVSLVLPPGRKLSSNGLPNVAQAIAYSLGVEREPPKDYRRARNGHHPLSRELEYWENIDGLRQHFESKLDHD